MPNPAPVLALLGIGTALALAASKSQAATPPAPTPAPRGTTVNLDTNLPPALDDQVVQALSTSHDPAELSALAAQLDTQGYPLAAAALRTRATQLQALATGPAATPPASTPSSTTPPTALPGLDPNIGSLGPAVLTALSTETDPAKLIGFAEAIQLQAPLAAAALMTKAASLQAAQRATQAAQAVAQNIPPTMSTTALPADASPPGNVPSTVAPIVAVPTTTPAATLDNVLPNLPKGPGAWVLATDADVARDGVAARYAALLSQAVGTTVTEPHNGRTWEFRVISKTTDPNLTTYAKDVKGWIWQPSATPSAPPPVLAPVVTSQTMATVPPSPAIRQLQHNLNLLGQQPPLAEDGLNGPKTIAAVKAFQTAHGLKVDGIAGPQTNGAIASALNPGLLVSSAPAPSVPVATRDAMHAPAPAAPASAAIRQLQHDLNLLGQQPPLAEDGLNGPKTIAAVKAFQGAHGLKVDGIAGPQTNSAIASALGGAHGPTVPASTTSAPLPAVVPAAAQAPAPLSTNVVTIQDVQAALNRLGIPQPLLKVDGVAGALTQAAVKIFQLQHGLTTDGVAGPLTKAALSRALAALATPQVSAGRRGHLARSAA